LINIASLLLLLTHYSSPSSCPAAAPALFYADWVHLIGENRTTLKAYRARLLARPSLARCIDDARPYRPFFPLGAPDRD
jgi:glutathione S-transferase